MQTLGRYQLISKLAAGGMAEVFLARTDGPAGFRKTLVVKRILPHLADNESFVEMFLNEARLVAPLNHPNVIQIFELGQADGTYFIAMELVDGPSLRALAKAARARMEFMPVPVILKIISNACEGLAYAHDFTDEMGRPLNLVHRDVSTDNLLLSRSGSVKVADFGIAKAANLPNVTKTGMLKGKITYMAPEHLLGEPLDRRADVFALGVVMHEVLAGAKPFDSTSEVAAMRAILQEPPRRLVENRPEVPEGLQAIVDRALEKDRHKRYPDMRALQGDIESLLIKLGVSVRPLDIAHLVESYFPKIAEDDKTEEGSLEALKKAMTTAVGIKSEEILAPDAPEPQRPKSSPPKAPPPLPEPTRADALTAPLQPVAPLLNKKRPSLEAMATQAPATAQIPLDREMPVRAPARSGGAKTLIAAGIGGAVAVVGALVFVQHNRPEPAQPTVVSIPAPAPAAAPAPVATAKSAPTPTPAPEPVKPTPTPEPAKPAPTPEPPHAVAANPPPTHSSNRHERHERERERERERENERAHATQHVVVVAAHSTTTTPAPTPTPAPATVPDKPGTLVVRIQPWAEVEIDGTSYGVTPISPVSLIAGSHSVRLKNSDLKINKVVPVSIRPGANTVLKLNLDE